MTRSIPTLLTGLLLMLAVLAPVQAQDGYVAGKDYEVISPALRTADPSTIEVREFFSYSCGHCYTFEPLVSRWKESVGDDVAVVPSPAIWNKPMELLARAYYTAEVLDVLDPLHLALFQAIHVDRQRLSSVDDIAAIFEAHGVSEEDFQSTFNSFGVTSMVRQADARARAARITGTPEMMVNGKYRITTRKAGSQAAMLEIAAWLVEQERASIAAAAATEGGDAG
jgi:thiol:disulfide interchange protein DsbA